MNGTNCISRLFACSTLTSNYESFVLLKRAKSLIPSLLSIKVEQPGESSYLIYEDTCGNNIFLTASE